MKSGISIAILVTGLLLLMISGLWVALFPPTSTWTAEKANRSAEIKARLSNIGPIVNGQAGSIHRGPDPATLKTEFDALKIEGAQLDAEFESAATRPNVVAKFLRWTGISLAVLGIVGWFALKDS